MTNNIARNRGSVICLVVAMSLLIGIIGICLCLFAKIMGGSRELRAANDAGSLNTAKYAPTIKAGISASHQGSAPPTAEYDNFHLLCSKTPEGADAVDLANYNMMAGQSLLVALNAQSLENLAKAKGGAAPVAGIHRQWITECLQGQQDSIAKRLSAGLLQPNVVRFADLAQANSVRMLDATHVTDQSAYGDVAFVDQGQASNLEVSDAIAEEIPAQMTTIVDGKRYLKGYFDYQAFGYALPIAISIPPNAQPHLVSPTKFEQERRLPNGIANLGIPPNAFRSKSSVFEKVSQRQLSVASCSQVGTLTKNYLSIPFGYIEICNGYIDPLKPGAPMNGEYIFKSGGFSDPPNLGTIEAYDRGANTYLFSKQKGLMDKLLQYNRNHGPQLTEAEQQQIFYSTGNVANAEERGKVAQEGAVFTCTNKDYTGTSRANMINLSVPSKTNGADPGIQFNNLIAMENCVQQLLQHLPQPVRGYCANVRPTGVRLYRQDVGYKLFPWYPTVDPKTGSALPCGQVSWEGTLPELLDHIFISNDGIAQNDNAKAEIELLHGEQGIYAKIHQIKPEATPQEIQEVLSSRRITNDGERYFIIMEDPLGHSATSRKLVIRCSSELSNVPPIWRPYSPPGGPPGRHYFPGGEIENPDGGYDCTISHTYPRYLGSTIINAEGFNPKGEDFASMTVEDTAIWTPGSGYNNFLGRLTLTERASGSVFNF